MKNLSFFTISSLLFIVERFTQNTEFTWYDHSLPMEERIEALVESMTLEEKFSQLMDEDGEISRLGVPRYG